MSDTISVTQLPVKLRIRACVHACIHVHATMHHCSSVTLDCALTCGHQIGRLLHIPITCSVTLTVPAAIVSLSLSADI